MQPSANQWSLVAMVVQPSNTTVYIINTNGLQTATNFLTSRTRLFAGPGTHPGPTLILPPRGCSTA